MDVIGPRGTESTCQRMLQALVILTMACGGATASTTGTDSSAPSDTGVPPTDGDGSVRRTDDTSEAIDLDGMALDSSLRRTGDASEDGDADGTAPDSSFTLCGSPGHLGQCVSTDQCPAFGAGNDPLCTGGQTCCIAGCGECGACVPPGSACFDPSLTPGYVPSYDRPCPWGWLCCSGSCLLDGGGGAPG
jgi:hypothetical protein